MNHTLFLIISAIISLYSLPAQAKRHSNNYSHYAAAQQFEGLHFELREVAESLSLEEPPIFTPAVVDPSNISFDELVAIGKKIFEIIQAGAPVVNIKTDTLSVVPKGITDWQELSGWQSPKVKTYQLRLQNRMNQTMADLRLKVSANWGGSLNEKGRFLANVTVVPVYVRVGWGVNLDVNVEMREPVNVGTRVQPIAGLGLVLHYQAKTWVSIVEGSQDYFIRGDGSIEVVPSNNQSPLQE